MEGSTLDEPGGFFLPETTQTYKDLARDIVRKELLPLEREFLASKNYAYGLPPMVNLQAVFDKKTVDRLVGIAKDTGFWQLQIPEEHGGQTFIVQPIAGQCAIAKIVDNDICIANQLAQDFNALGVFHIDRQTLLIAVC
jgi:alkylation response protein AidB-like acyl-CoA dehydrogenase